MAFEDDLVKDLKKRFPDDVKEATVSRPGRVKASVTRDGLRQVCFFLREEKGFEHISCISGVDWVDRLENIYHILSYENECIIQVSVEIPADDPSVPTVSEIWKGALFHEREAYDMLGIDFQGHPDLRRILLPNDFKFHPLRKDYTGE